MEIGHAHDVTVETTFEFVNTLDREDGKAIERLPTLRKVLGWFEDRDLIHREGADLAMHRAVDEPEEAERVLEHVYDVRAALREVSDAVVEHRVPTAGALDLINRALHARQVIELVPVNDGVHVGHRHVGDPVDDALARLADALVQELTIGQPERIRICDNEACRWVFFDTSRTGRRRWCDMATCGNRAKQARHRARTKVRAASEPLDGSTADPGTARVPSA